MEGVREEAGLEFPECLPVKTSIIVHIYKEHSVPRSKHSPSRL